MLYTLKMTEEEIKDIIDIMNKYNQRHVEECNKYGVEDNEGLYYVNKLVNYLEDEMEIQSKNR